MASYLLEFECTMQKQADGLTIFVEGLGVTLEGRDETTLRSEFDGILDLLRRYADGEGDDVFLRIMERRGVKVTLLSDDAPAEPIPFRMGKVLA